MTQFYLPKPELNIPGAIARLEGDEARHARDAYRLKEGDPIRLFDGAGSAALGTILAASKAALDVRIDRCLASDPVFRARLDLAQALVPHQTMDEIVRQATELGVSRIWPIACERSVVRLDAGKRTAKLDHWKRTSMAACKQCDRNTLPEILPVTTPGELIGRFGEYGAVYAACPQGAQGELELAGSRSELMPDRVLVLIGPEGDFTPGEMDAFRKAGARVVTLGPLILKSDTAAASALSVLQYLIRTPDRP